VTPPRLARNYSAGPGALPSSVLLQAQQALLALPGTGVSILGLSHRTQLFRSMVDEAEERVRRLLGLEAGYQVLFLQGGGTLQFSMVPLAMLGEGQHADYVRSGYWSTKAIETARYHGRIRVVWDGEPGGFRELPAADTFAASAEAAYLHYVSNETVEGLQWHERPQVSCPLVCDMSSDFLSRPVDYRDFSLVYAHAQKNVGPAGVTIVVLRDEVLAGVPRELAPLLDYRAHSEARSVLHTPPVFSIYVVLLVLRWLEDEIGGLGRMGQLNAAKAALLRDALAAHPSFYLHDVGAEHASQMNVTFRCPTTDLDLRFVQQAEEAGLVGTEGHRSREGLRISLYNAVTLEDAEVIAEFARDFARRYATLA
jgi:phosphoserine aminotransferase